MGTSRDFTERGWALGVEPIEARDVGRASQPAIWWRPGKAALHGGPTLAAFVFLLSGWLTAGVAQAQLLQSAPDELEGVGVVEQLDTKVPVDLEFTESDGKTVRLGQFLDGKRPVILTLNYSDCPMLCHQQLNGLLAGLDKLDWNVGERFQIVTVSIDPKEPVERAAGTKAKYLKRYGRKTDVAAGWHFLTGSEANIRALADRVGFGYRYDPRQKQFVHMAALMVLTPDGRVARYLYGVEYPPQTLRLALLEASEGKIGTPGDQILMFCFHYDPGSRRYGLAAMRLMQVAGGFTVLVLGGVLGMYWLRERRRGRKAGRKREEEAQA